MDKTREEMIAQFKSNIEGNKKHHDMAVLMGSLGVSQKLAQSYFDSIKKIKEYQTNNN